MNASSTRTPLHPLPRLSGRRAHRLLGVAALTSAWLLAGSAVAEAQQSVVYEVAFRGTWAAADHQNGAPLPQNAHFTALVGTTHPPGLPLWEPGGLATPGVEEVAEAGFAGTLFDEIDARVALGDAGEFVGTSGLGGFPRTRRAEFIADLDHPSLSVLSMIAPSPDWFVGVSDLALRDQTGWIDQVQVDLVPWDAGTENGDAFQLDPNTDTVPVATIAPRGFPFVANAVIGRLTFTLVPEANAPANAAAAAAALLLLARGRRARSSDVRG